jgi:hypothetical protein
MANLLVQYEIIVELKVVKSMNNIHNSAMFVLSEGKGANQTPDISRYIRF